MVLYSTIEDSFPQPVKDMLPMEKLVCLWHTRHLLLPACIYHFSNTGAALSANERALGPGNKLIESILSHSQEENYSHQILALQFCPYIFICFHNIYMYCSIIHLKNNHKKVSECKFKVYLWLLGIWLKILEVTFDLRKTKYSAVLQKIEDEATADPQ